MECTVSTEQGRTWAEYQNGSRSRIVLPCPHCDEWVAPEREHLVGWQQAANRIEAQHKGAFACPACGQVWSDQERVRANQRARLLHGEQSIGEGGGVLGDPGHRYSGVPLVGRAQPVPHRG